MFNVKHDVWIVDIFKFLKFPFENFFPAYSHLLCTPDILFKSVIASLLSPYNSAVLWLKFWLKGTF